MHGLVDQPLQFFWIILVITSNLEQLWVVVLLICLALYVCLSIYPMFQFPLYLTNNFKFKFLLVFCKSDFIHNNV